MASFLTKILPRKRPQTLSDGSEVSSSKPSRPSDSRRNTGSSLSVPQTPTSRTSISTTRSTNSNRIYDGPRLDEPLKWFQTCAKNHRHCAELGESSFRPTRLIDLGIDFDFKRAHLVERCDESFHVNYLALSYCWGSNMPEAGKTYKRTLDEHKIKLKRAKLPRTFKHFFEIAKWLDVRYVWIDSLCIIQDSSSDWQTECAAMGSIFSGAVCTIAAESAKDCQGGIWLENRIRMINGVTSPIYQDMSQEDNLRHYLSVCDQRFHKSPLQNRGWAVQEREVSHRVLHFTFAHIFWECREAKMHCPVLLGESDLFVGSSAGIRESSAEWKSTKLRAFDIRPEHKAENSPQSPRNGQPSYFNAHHVSAQSKALELLNSWRNIIEVVSARAFTQWTDRLPSLWGLGYELQKRLPSEYQAGVWCADPKGLLWTVQDSVHPLSRVRDLAPSWSWAAFRNPITYSDIPTLPEDATTTSQIISMGTDFWNNDFVDPNSWSGLTLNCRVRWVSTFDELRETRYSFFREDSAANPTFDYTSPKRVLLMRVLVFGGKDAWALTLKPRPDSLETVFERLGVVGGIDARWFEEGFEKNVTIV